MISVREVELNKPPITTVASSAPIIPLSVVEKAANGNKAKVVVKAVINIGLSLILPP